MIGVLQAFLVAPLFAGEFTQFRGSIEAAFITDARFIADHFPDLSWSPLWYLGFPFEWFYTPLLPTAVAVVGKLSGDVPHAYRVVSALGFALGPVALYLAARELTRSRWVATIAAAAFMFFPSLSYVFTPVRGDATAVSGAIVAPPWRLIALVEYGEGPHVLSLTLALFAVTAAIRYAREPRDRRLALAVGLVVAVALTNLIGVLGAALFFFGIGASRSSGLAAGARWGRLARVGIYAGLFSLGWYSLGFIRAVFGFSAPGGEGGGSFYVALPGVLLVVYIAGDLLGRRRWPMGLDTVLLWMLTFGAIVVPQQLFQVALAPQPIRYLLELDAAFAIAIGIATVWVGDQLLTRLRPVNNRRFAVAVGAVLLFLAIGLPGWRAVRPALEPDPGWDSWSERRVAVWLQDHLRPGERAYLSGSHAFWADVFADVPQVRGGVDFASTNPWWAHVTYQVNTGADRDISRLWFEALPVRYVVVTDATSTDVYRDFVDPHKFDGLLPVVFDERGVRIYEVPPVGDPTFMLVRFGRDARAPVNAIDRAPLESYVADLKAAVPPKTVTQTGLASWRVGLDAPSDTTLLLRQAYDTGWHATVDGNAVPVHADAIGQTAIVVPAGSHVVSIVHRVHRDLLLGLAVSLSAALWLILRRIRGRLGVRLAAPAVGARADVAIGFGLLVIVVAVGERLGIWSGFPKGTDAYAHLTRLRFVADHFPNHHWLYSWSAGMPIFETYPALPYLLGAPVAKLFGAPAALHVLAFAGYALLAVGLYGAVRVMTGSRLGGLVAALATVSSMAVWTWVADGGVYARVVAAGLGAGAAWAAAVWLRGDGRRAFVLTAALVAAGLSAHQFIGALFALAVAGMCVTARVPVRRIAALVGLSFLLSAPAILPAVFSYGGFGGRFLGVDDVQLTSSPNVLWEPVDVGFAALPLLLLGVIAGRTLGRGLVLLLAALGATMLYLFAPNIGVPARFYNVNGIAPFSVTFLVAIAASVAAGVAIAGGSRRLAPRGRWPLAAVVALVLAAQLAIAPAAFADHRGNPSIEDTSYPDSIEEIARRSLQVDGADLAHRYLPASASESVFFSYLYAKPQLRDYYGTGVVHPDWLAWANAAVYTPPFDAQRFAAALDWFAIDEFSVDLRDPNFTGNLADFARSPLLRVAGESDPPIFRRYAVTAPQPAVRETNAKLLVVASDLPEYDTIARIVMERTEAPGGLLPIRWPGAVGDLPGELVARAATIVVTPGAIGDEARATEVLQGFVERGGRAVYDAGSSPGASLPRLWPVSSYSRALVPAWRLTAAPGVAPPAFADASFEGGPWNAPLAAGLEPGAIADLSQDGRPLIAHHAVGAGRTVWIGGNLFFHARSKRSVSETHLLLAQLGVPHDLPTPLPATFVRDDPEHLRVMTTGASGVLVSESFHPSWGARWSDGLPVPVAYAGPGVMYVPVPAEAGVLTLSHGLQPAEVLAWVLFGLGALVSTLARRLLSPARTGRRPR